MMSQGASCLCLTYGRTDLLEEAVESFKRQRWDGPKELIIVNDHPGQELVYTDVANEVVIVNLKRRLRTLGEKRNFAVALAKFEYLLIWDDDDIHLPWRIEETMKALSGWNFFKCPQVWVTFAGKLVERPQQDAHLFHCAGAYSRHLFVQLGGYRCLNGGEDQDFERRIRLNPALSRYWNLTSLPIDRLYYIYRRSHGHYHASGCIDLGEIDPTIREGIYELRPNWKKDYCEEIARQVERVRDRETTEPR
jgi:glycosyltransferase involved in cell wall biosynthesis